MSRIIEEAVQTAPLTTKEFNYLCQLYFSGRVYSPVDPEREEPEQSLIQKGWLKVQETT